MLPANVAVVGAAGDGHGGVVLLRSVHVIQKLVVGRHVVELRRRLVVLRRPALSAIHSDRRPAIVAVNHSRRIYRIDPQSVMIAVRRR